MPRFGDASDTGIKKKREEVQNKNTIGAEKRAEKAFKAFLLEQEDIPEDQTDFYAFDTETLDKWLGKFWFAARTQKEQLYTISTLDNMRYALNRCLKKAGKTFDITKSEAFIPSQQAFMDAARALKKEGKGVVNSHKEIAPNDLFKLYTSTELDPSFSTRSLMQKVQFDIRFYFARRGAENMREMPVDTFDVIVDQATGFRYVKKMRDEMTKNHKDKDKEITTGFMPEIPGNHMCPVESFIKYVSHLHPESTSLWQKPISHPVTNVWFGPSTLPENSMKNFMQNLSKNAGLSKRYTNHDIRVTGCSILSRAKYSNKQISSISGHRSMESLALYQRVSADEKLSMGITLNCALLAPETIPNAIAQGHNSAQSAAVALPPPESCKPPNDMSNNKKDDEPPASAAIVQYPEEDQPSKEIVAVDVPMEQENLIPPDCDFDIAELLKDVSKPESTTVNTLHNNTQINVRRSPPKMPAFNNCTIGTVNFNIVQK